MTNKEPFDPLTPSQLATLQALAGKPRRHWKAEIREMLDGRDPKTDHTPDEEIAP